MDLYPVTVVENFYTNPDGMRKFALSQEYKFCHEFDNLKYVYPGSRSAELFKLNPMLYERICKKLVSLFHNTDHDYMRWALSTSFQSVTADYGAGVIHTDKNTVFAAVLYLNPEPQAHSGTTLFRPNRHFDPEKYEQALQNNDARFRAGEKTMHTDYHAMFDEWVTVNNVYNSLILYEGKNYHAAGTFFGDNFKNSRLTQVFFISRVDAQSERVFPIKRQKQADKHL